MILKEILPDYYYSRFGQTFSAPFGMDDPKISLRSADEWHVYEPGDFNYSFNSWAFRGRDYEQFLGQPVNICLGDSFTLNIGGPVEYSWPSQLASHFDIPTLNFGVDGAGNDTIRMVYEYLLTVFDVQKTFVMYSFFHRRYDSYSKKLTQDVYADKENFAYFEHNKISNACYVFLPPWCWSDTEKKYLCENYRAQHMLHVDTIDKNQSLHVLRAVYDLYKGTDWPLYDDFVAGKQLDNRVYSEIFETDLKYDLFRLVNRDGFHLNYAGNKTVCDYFLSQVGVSQTSGQA